MIISISCDLNVLPGETCVSSVPRDLLITSLDSATTFDELCAEVREMCWLHPGHPLTLKWVDNEGGPCGCGGRAVAF